MRGEREKKDELPLRIQTEHLKDVEVRARSEKGSCIPQYLLTATGMVWEPISRLCETTPKSLDICVAAKSAG